MKDFLNLGRIKKAFLILFPLILLILFIALLSFNAFFDSALNKTYIYPDVDFVFAGTKYPVLNSPISTFVSAKGAIIMDLDSKVVIYSKNPDLRYTPASTTKIMTALTAIDYFKPTDILTVKTATFSGSVIGLKIGQKMTFQNLLYGMLLPSGNDAAETIAQNYPLGRQAFINQMNENAKKWNLYSTKFEDPSGLSDNNYTTPLDLARLAGVAAKNKKLAEVVATKEKIVFDASGFPFELKNLNKLLGYNGINGIKTGYTDEAGQVLATSKLFSLNGQEHRLIVIVMGSDDRFFDTQNLVDSIEGNINYLSILP